ncbi:MAG: PHP domain-containing protein [Clostridia bacterium]|nr:PHP domain-containing protein [Clostridia bacterium]
MILSNPHTHTFYVDGKDSPEDMARAAFELGFESLGFSEHAHQPAVDTMYGISPENRAKYIFDVNALKVRYAGKMRLWLGFEIDIVSDETASDVDYFIGASHYFVHDDEFAAIDGDPDKLESYVARHFGGSWDRAIESYFESYASFIAQRKPDFIAHFDLIKKSNTKRSWFDESRALTYYGKLAMKQMLPHCDLMELNLGGMLRSGQNEPYPIPELLKYWHDLGGKVIPSTDCHNRALLNGKFDFAPDYMRAAGYEEFTVLGNGEKLFETRRL